LIQWRQLLDEIGVEWWDRGANCSRNNVNINCPLCGDDPSHHLAIAEHKVAWICWRDSAHRGTSVHRLLVALGVPYGEVAELCNRHNTEVAYKAPPKPPPSTVAAAWDRFEPAGEHSICISYLRGRGFPAPGSTCRLYDLRYCREGTWAKRLLIPIRLDGAVVSWLGRDMTGRFAPKYKMQQSQHEDLTYSPRMPRDVLVVVEGSVDALKVAVATTDRPVSSVALLGKNFSTARVRYLAKLAKDCKRVLIALDSDTSIVDTDALYYELSSRVRCAVDNLPMPRGYKDAAELTLEQINEWLDPVVGRTEL